MRHILIIATVTLRELIRGKTLYGIFGIVTLLLLCATFFGTVTIGSQAKVIKDFALFLVSVSSAGLAIFAGTSLLNKELTRKTIYNILSKPVRRSEFIIGKFCGMFSACAIVIMTLLPLCMLYISVFEPAIDPSLLIAAPFMLVEAAILCAAALLFSAIVATPSLSGVLVFALFLAGRSVESLQFFIQSPATTAPLRTLLIALYWILPQLSRYASVGDTLVYGDLPDWRFTAAGLLYGVSYAGVLLLLAIGIFTKKELQ